MSDDNLQPTATPETTGTSPKLLEPQAVRALREAEARRAEYAAAVARLPREIGGRGGQEPGRYGDWEIKGLTSDF